MLGSSSLTRFQTWAPCIGSAQSETLGYQGSPPTLNLAFQLYEPMHFLIILVIKAILWLVHA